MSLSSLKVYQCVSRFELDGELVTSEKKLITLRDASKLISEMGGFSVSCCNLGVRTLYSTKTTEHGFVQVSVVFSNLSKNERVGVWQQ